MRWLSPLRLFQGEGPPSQMFLGAERTLGSASWDLAVSSTFTLPPFPFDVLSFSLLVNIRYEVFDYCYHSSSHTTISTVRQAIQSFPHAVSPQLHPININFWDQVISLFSLLRVKYIVYYPSIGICCGISATNELLEHLMDPSMNIVSSLSRDFLQINGGFRV